MAKMGRPKSDDPMNYRFTIRFSNAEQKQLEKVRSYKRAGA